MMKIAIVVPIVGNFGRKGFYHSQEIGLGKQLIAMGNDVVVYKCVPLNSMKNIHEEKYAGLLVKYIPTKSIGPHGMFDVTLIDQNIDTVLVFADTQLIIPKLYKYCVNNGVTLIPYIGIAHSFQKNFKSKLMDLVFRATTLEVYRKISVIAKTVDARDELYKLGVKKCQVAPVGMDFDSLRHNFENYNRIGIRNKWGFDAEDCIIYFVARLQPEKHPLELVDIFQKIKKKKKKLLIVGKGPLDVQLKEKIKHLGLENQVTVINEVKYEDIWQIHYMADYFLNLRDDEIFGMAIMEAVYYKSCVIAIRAPGPNTILNGMKGHFICNTFEEVEKVLESENINVSELEKAHQILENKFSWKTCASQLLRYSNGD